jgi:very-short-patch-repair endonuclease
MDRVYYREYKKIKPLASNLRNDPTATEILLWEVLRKKSLFGFKFLRQHPIIYRVDKGWAEFFIPDFYCSRLKLIIELDGPIHNFRKEYDSERDSKLLSKGIKVIRIENDELADINSVVLKIKDIIKLRISQITDLK